MKRTLTVAIASLALALAGCGGDDEEASAPAADTNTGTSATPPPATPEGTGDGEPTNLKISADPGGNLAFTKDSLTAEAGEVTITMDNPSNLPHAVGIEGNGVDTTGQVVEKGGTSEATATLSAGTYQFYCPVPGHTEGGMVGELTVE